VIFGTPWQLIIVLARYFKHRPSHGQMAAGLDERMIEGPWWKSATAPTSSGRNPKQRREGACDLA
jgi:hypothetical protein